MGKIEFMRLIQEKWRGSYGRVAGRWITERSRLAYRLCLLLLLLQDNICVTTAYAAEGNRLVPYSSGSGLYMSGGGSADYASSGSGEPLTAIPTASENEDGSGNEQGIIMFAFSGGCA